MKSEVPENNNIKQIKILLGHLGRRGDCLYATTIARQIKQDFPDSHLTWAISSMCRSVIEGNPYVDEIWELPLNSNEEIVSAWKQFEIDVRNKKNHEEYDEVYLTQVHPGNFQNYDGTSRSSIFRSYPRPITVSVQPVVRLSDKEIENVRKFAHLHQLPMKKNVILFECASTSGQSFVTPDFAFKVAKKVLKNNPDVYFILSSNLPIHVTERHIIDGSALSFKENAELTKYCSLLVGCSSGISWLATSDWAKPLPKIQLLKADTVMYASMIYDAMYFGLPTEQILEMQDCKPEHVASCIQVIFDSGFTSAKQKYHQDIPLNFGFYFQQLSWELLRKNELGKAAGALSVARERFGDHPRMIYFLKNIFFPYADLMWTHLSKIDQMLLVDHLSYKRPSGIFILTRNMISLFKLFKSLFIADTHKCSRMLIVTIIIKRFIYA
jgi:hypothetical protein